MRVDDLLRGGTLAGVTLVAGPWDARPVEEVMIVDDLADVARAGRGVVAILTRSASAHATGYELDLVLRNAGDRELAAVAVYGPATTSLTAIRLADRSRVALLAIAQDRDLSQIAFELEKTLRSGADAMLRRIMTTLAAVRETEGVTLGSILVSASEALETQVRYTELPEGLTTVPVMLASRPEGYVCAEASDSATLVGCQLVADAIARVRLSLRSSWQAAAQARAAAIGDVLAAGEAQLASAAERARLFELPIDGRHSAIAIEPYDAGGARPDEGLLGRARSLADDHGVGWYVLAVDHTILAVRALHPGAGAVAVDDALLVAERIVGGLVARTRSSLLVCGVSGNHEGVVGLRAAAGEARTALATARAESRVNEPLRFDSSPVRRLLAEFVSASSGRGSVDALLAPLDRLGGRRARTAVDTLQVYLDERGSLTAAARRLHLHPNAVGYRMRRIRDRLEVDLDDPDQRLAVQIACRAWLMTAGEAERRTA
jgi:sugar diacid utilization regulator